MLRLAAHGAMLAAQILKLGVSALIQNRMIFSFFFPLSSLIRKDKGSLKSTNKFAVEMSLDLATQLHSLCLSNDMHPAWRTTTSAVAALSSSTTCSRAQLGL